MLKYGGVHSFYHYICHVGAWVERHCSIHARQSGCIQKWLCWSVFEVLWRLTYGQPKKEICRREQSLLLIWWDEKFDRWKTKDPPPPPRPAVSRYYAGLTVMHIRNTFLSSRACDSSLIQSWGRVVEHTLPDISSIFTPSRPNEGDNSIIGSLSLLKSYRGKIILIAFGRTNECILDPIQGHFQFHMLIDETTTSSSSHLPTTSGRWSFE